jgi:hypothetical protein
MRVGDPEPPHRGGEQQRHETPQDVHREQIGRGQQHRPGPQHTPPPSPAPMKKISDLMGGLQGTLEGLFSKITSELETEDLILLLILYLLYRESGDEELLIMMGALVFL